MTTQDLISRIVNYTDNTDSTDADNVTRRGRILQYCQEVFDYVWNFRPWIFKYRTSTVTINGTTGIGDLPADFNSLGPEGKLYDTSSGRQLWEDSYYKMMEKIRLGLQAGNPPELFALGGLDTVTFQRTVQIIPPGTALTLTLDYEAKSPILVDAASSSNLELIPADYHFSVLLPGVHARTAQSQGDIRDWVSQFKQGLNYMVVREMPQQSKVRQMPRHSVGLW
jgi:hypothetical protein